MINGIIYKVTNKINGKVYIGLTTKELKVRKSKHLYASNCSEKTSIIFYNAIKKYGWDSFTWEIIDQSYDTENLKEKERFWIKHYESNLIGYNMTEGGDGVTGLKSMQRGADHHNAILTDKEVLKIKDIIIEGKLTDAEIGEIFGVGSGAISNIKTGRAWSNIITEADVNEMNNGEYIRKERILKEEDVRIIASLLIENKITLREIGEKFGVTMFAISSIKRGKNWRKFMEKEGYLDIIKNQEKRGVKLLESEVILIKNLLIEGIMTNRAIALQLNVSGSLVTDIKKRKIWSHLISDEDFEKMNRKDKLKIKRLNSTITGEDVLNIKKLLKEGKLYQKDIAELYGVDQGTVSNIKKGKTWSEIKLEDDPLDINQSI